METETKRKTENCSKCAELKENLRNIKENLNKVSEERSILKEDLREVRTERDQIRLELEKKEKVLTIVCYNFTIFTVLQFYVLKFV